MVIKLLTLASAALLLGACTSQNGEDLLASGGVPTPACDTSHVTYAGTVAPILQQCSGCHGGSQPAAAFAVSSYAQVRAKAASGSLLGTLNHDPGYSPMPKGGAKLSDCDLAKLRQWVAAGAPNN
jgi:mono/diheme cytochrome c family protein